MHYKVRQTKGVLSRLQGVHNQRANALVSQVSWQPFNFFSQHKDTKY